MYVLYNADKLTSENTTYSCKSIECKKFVRFITGANVLSLSSKYSIKKRIKFEACNLRKNNLSKNN